MISIIICSRTTELSASLTDNVSSTIGSNYELIGIDNSGNKYSIFSAYNEGVRRSHGEILCFMHDDIIFHSHDWGRLIEEQFNIDENNNIGIIGILGGHIISANNHSWMGTLYRSGDIIQSYFDNKGIKHSFESRSPNIFPFHNNLLDVSVIDGLIFFAKKEIFNQIKFDEQFYGHCFHAYDIDISMQCWNAGYRVCVTNHLNVEHLSSGKLNQSWHNAMHLFSEKWKDILPFVQIPSTESQETIIKSNLQYEELQMQNEVLTHKLAVIRQTIPYRILAFFRKII